MTNEETQLTVFQASNNAIVSGAIGSMENALRRAAEANVAQLDGDFTDLETEAMVTIEELKLVNGLDLAAVLLRGDLLRKIEQEALWTIHPGRYETLEQMARDQGISTGELSQVRDLTQIIFPYMEENLGMSIAETWEEIGKSNFREMVPVLKALITGDEPATASTRNAVQRQLDDVAATAVASGQELDDDQQAEQAVRNLIEAGAVMTNRDLRQTLRPERTDSVDLNLFRIGERRIMIAEIDEDQWVMVQRRLGSAMDPIVITLPEEGPELSREAAQHTIIRAIAGLLE